MAGGAAMTDTIIAAYDSKFTDGKSIKLGRG
jgi:hypothetical protein